MSRIQIDLIDMRDQPDGEFKWIVHDHWSKFHVMWPLTRKTAQQVADGLQEKVFAVFGPPKIFQSDNGREFVNDILREVLKMWGNKDVLFVNGRPRHCQSQGLVEQGNYSIEKQIANKRTELGMENQPCPWAKCLPEIQLTLNTMKSEATKHTAYELVFGQPFQSNIFPGARPAGGHILLEEDYDEEMAATALKADLKSQTEIRRNRKTDIRRNRKMEIRRNRKMEIRRNRKTGIRLHMVRPVTIRPNVILP